MLPLKSPIVLQPKLHLERFLRCECKALEHKTQKRQRPTTGTSAAILEVLLEGENVEEGIDTQALADIAEGYRWTHKKVSPVLERRRSRKEAVLASLLSRRRLLLPSPP
jgi:hypothetical protein